MASKFSTWSWFNAVLEEHFVTSKNSRPDYRLYCFEHPEDYNVHHYNGHNITPHTYSSEPPSMSLWPRHCIMVFSGHLDHAVWSSYALLPSILCTTTGYYGHPLCPFGRLDHQEDSRANNNSDSSPVRTIKSRRPVSQGLVHTPRPH